MNMIEIAGKLRAMHEKCFPGAHGVDLTNPMAMYKAIWEYREGFYGGGRANRRPLKAMTRRLRAIEKLTYSVLPHPDPRSEPFSLPGAKAHAKHPYKTPAAAAARSKGNMKSAGESWKTTMRWLETMEMQSRTRADHSSADACRTAIRHIEKEIREAFGFHLPQSAGAGVVDTEQALEALCALLPKPESEDLISPRQRALNRTLGGIYRFTEGEANKIATGIEAFERAATAGASARVRPAIPGPALATPPERRDEEDFDFSKIDNIFEGISAGSEPEFENRL